MEFPFLKKYFGSKSDWILLCLLAVPILLYPVVHNSEWRSNSDIHAMLEFWAAFTALTAGSLILLQFFASKKLFYLYISLGFIVQGSEDLLHAVISFGRFFSELPHLDRFVPGTYAAGRLMLVILLLIAAFKEGNMRIVKDPGRKALLFCIGGFILGIFLTIILSQISLPQMIHRGDIVSRPFDFLIAFLFLLALILFWQISKSNRGDEILIWTITASIALGVMAEIYMVQSEYLYDSNFDAAHLLKIASYYFPIFGAGAAILKMYHLIEDEKVKLFTTSEKLRTSNKELEQFVYVASHDLQEPLRMVSSYMTLLESRYKNKIDEKADRIINYAVDGAKRMQTLIHDLLELSRTNTRPLNLNQIDLNNMLNRLQEIYKTGIAESGSEVRIKDLPTILADETQMERLFSNLISNAIKFRQKGKRNDIQIEAVNKKDKWLFTVEDSGIGIEEKYAEKVFEIFQRLHTREEYSGTGIGLAVCQRIVARHGGEIWFKSEKGKGSKFYFTISKKLRTENGE